MPTPQDYQEDGDEPEFKSFQSVVRRYPMLRFLEKVLFFVGFFGIVIGLIALLNTAMDRNTTVFHVYAALILVVTGLVCFTCSEVIPVMIHTEENSRASAQFLSRLAEKLAPSNDGRTPPASHHHQNRL